VSKHETTPTAAEEFLPFDVEVEQAILGAVLTENSSLPVALAELEEGDFYDPFHRRIFARMVLFDDEGRTISPLSLSSSLKKDPAGVDLGQQSETEPEEAVRRYFINLARSAPAQTPVVEYCRILVELRERREARGAVEDASWELYRGEPTQDAITRVVEVADKIALRRQHARGSGDISDAFDKLARDVERASTTGQLPGITTGLAPLDRQLGGYMPSDLIVIAGRPGMGKSVFACQAARVAGGITDGQVRLHDPTIFSLEMSEKENAARLVAELDYDWAIREGRKPLEYTQLVKGRLKTEDFERFVLLGQALQDFGIKIYDEGRMTVAKIGALARARAQLSPRRPFVIVDNLQIVGSPPGFRGSRLEALTEITAQLKALAKKLDAPVLALSHLNRGVEAREDKRPNLGDLRESGSIEQDADAVLFLYRPEYYLRAALKHARALKNDKRIVELERQQEQDRGVLEIDVAKNRSGGTGDVRVFIDVASNAVRDKRPDPGEYGPARLPGLGGDPLDGLDDLARRTGA
jgi:replicative DNA helicase